MKTKTINLYQFSELSEKAKEKAISTWYENEDCSFLTYDLTESLKSLLNQNGCEFYDIKVLYSLSHSQGDGLCFTGTISKNGKKIVIEHNYRYYFASSVTFVHYDIETGEEIDEADELRKIYFDACELLENEGYSTLDYRMDNEAFVDFCEGNEYFFLEDGTLE